MKKKIFLIILVFFITFDYFVKLNINEELSKFNTNIKVQSKYRYEKIDEEIWGNRRYYLNPYKLFQYNEYGYKSKNGDVRLNHKDDNEFRVFLFGGSAMASSPTKKNYRDLSGLVGIKYENTISHKLEDKLNKSKIDRNISFKVIDSAVATQTLPQVFLHLKNSIKHNPDLIILMAGFNDYEIAPDANIDLLLKTDFDIQQQNTFFYKTIGFFSQHSGIFYYLIQNFYYHNSSRIKNNYTPQKSHLMNETFINQKYLNLKNNLTNKDKKKIELMYLNFEKRIIKITDYLKEKNINYIIVKQPMIFHKNYIDLTLIEKAIYSRWLSYKPFEINYYNELIKKNYNLKEENNNIYFPIKIIQSKQHTFSDFTHFSLNGIEQITDYFFDIIKQKNFIKLK